jgi:poly(A) polymerase
MVRFREDPVRILRAIRFCARRNLGITPDGYDAIVQCREALAMAARPRLFEEVLRLMRGGAAHRSLWLCWETGVLDVLLPELSTYLSDVEESDDRVWRLLTEVDRAAVDGQRLDDIVLWAALLLAPMREVCDTSRDRVAAAFDFLEPVVERLAVPRRIADAVRRIVGSFHRLETGRPGRFARTTLYPLACEVLELSQAAANPREESAASVEEETPSEEGASTTGDANGARRRRRRRRRVNKPAND